MFSIKPTATKILLLSLLVLAAALRIYHLSYKSISIDEAIGGFYAMEPLYRVGVLTINDVHPPAFYILHHFWIEIFGTSEAGLRSISVFFGVLSVFGLFMLGRLAFNHKVGLLAALLLTISPWHLWLSQNARSNSMLLFLVILSTYTFFQLLRTNDKKWFIGYCVITTLALYIHYFAFLVWLAQNAYVVFHSYIRKRLLKNWLPAQINIMAAYMFWLPLMISQLITKARPMYKGLSPQFIKKLFDFLNPYASAKSVWIIGFGELICAILFIFGIISLMKRRHKIINAQKHLTIARSALAFRLTSRFLVLFAVITIVAGYYLSMSRTLPLLQEQIKINDPIIYADSIRPYHLEQLRSLPVSFFVAAAIALVLFFAFKYSDLLAEKIDLFLDKITFRSPLLKTINKTGFSAAGFLLMHAFLPLLFAGLISLKSHYLLLRNMVIVIPAYLLIISFAVIRLRQKWTRIGIISIFVLFFMQSMICFEQWNKKDDWRSLAQIAKAKINDGEIILLDHLFGKKPFYYYGLRTAVPIRRVDAQKFLSNIQSDLWLLVSYKGEWTVRDSLAGDFEPIEDFNFSGSTNEDDLPTIDGHVHLIHYRRKQAGGENRLIRKMSTSLSINR